MTRKYPFFTRIAYIAHFWNSVDPIYSSKNVANKKRRVGGVPAEVNLFVPFRIEKAHFSEKKILPTPNEFSQREKRPFRWF